MPKPAYKAIIKYVEKKTLILGLEDVLASISSIRPETFNAELPVTKGPISLGTVITVVHLI